MAEVVGAIGGAVNGIAIAAAVGAITSLVYFIWNDTMKYVPLAGSVAFGSMFATVFNRIDPFLGMGLAVALGYGVYTPLKLLVATRPPQVDDMPNGVDLAKALKLNAQLICSLPLFGLVHASSQSLPAATVAGAAGFYLGGKYAWNTIVEFYLWSGLMGNRYCSSKNADQSKCVQGCSVAEQDQRRTAFLNTPPCSGPAIGQDAQCVSDWCKQKANFIASCPWNPVYDPGPMNCGGTQNPPTAGLCQSYAPIQQTGNYSFPGACGSVDRIAAIWALQVTGDANNAKWYKDAQPVSFQDFDAFYNPVHGTYGSIDSVTKKQRTWAYLKDAQGIPIPGRVQMIDDMGDWIIGLVNGYGNGTGFGTILNASNQAPNNATCVWQSHVGSTDWFLDSRPPLPQGDPPQGNSYNWRDFDGKDAPLRMAQQWTGRRVCAPTKGGGPAPIPLWNMGTQPVDSDRGKFCKTYDSKKDGTSMIVPYFSTNEFQCQVGNDLMPKAALKWPW